MHIKKVKLINQDCLSIIVLLYIVLYIMIAYLMLFAALSNAVCFFDASFFPFISANAFCFHALSWSIAHSLFISCVDLHNAQCF